MLTFKETSSRQQDTSVITQHLQVAAVTARLQKKLMHSYKIYQIKHTLTLNHFSTTQNNFTSHIYFCNIQLSIQELHFSVRSVSNKLTLLTYRFKYCNSFKNPCDSKPEASSVHSCRAKTGQQNKINFSAQ